MTPDQLFPQVYDELRKLAAAKMRLEAHGHSLDATALVHEAFLKLGGDRSFATRNDFFLAAAQAMRRILVDHARARNAAKRGPGLRVPLEPDSLAVTPPDDSLEALDDALTRLSLGRPQLAQLVQLRHFGGLSLSECATVLGISPRTADSWWSYSRAWLALELEKSGYSPARREGPRRPD